MAIDAPLGWPAALGERLAQHRAGDALGVQAHRLFRRSTDEFIARTLKKQPLDVGANLIARAAHTALRLLGKLRGRLDAPIPLAWRWPAADKTAAIEVYPGALLAVLGLKGVRYKGAADADLVDGRRHIARRLGDCLALPGDGGDLVQNDHLLDAALCVLAGEDFVLRRALAPRDELPFLKEGWIWCRPLPRSSLG